MQRSESISNLAASLVKAQSEFPMIPKTKEVLVQSQKGSYTFKYAPLEEAIKVIRPTLAKYGLGFTQGADGDRLITTILHESGEWFEHSMPLPDQPFAQQYGAQLTYRRRYALKAALGIETDEDDADTTQPEQKKIRATPTQGAMDRVEPERKKDIEKTASVIVDCCNADRFDDAYKVYKAVTDTDEKVAVWSFLDSGMRRKLKAMDTEANRNSLRTGANATATQA